MNHSLPFRFLGALLVIAGLFFSHRPTLAAGTITVTTTADTLADDGQCSLREAVIAANTDTATGGCAAGNGADTIVFSASLSSPAVFSLTLTGANEDAAASGDLDLLGTLSIQATPGQVIVDGNGTDRVFDVRSGANVTLVGLTIRNGNPGSGGSGGGVRVTGTMPATKLTLLNSLVQSNHAVSGGGIQTEGSGATLILQDSRLTGNAADGAGGGIINNGVVKVLNSTLDHNQALSGGGIDHEGTSLEITNSTLSNNFGRDSGGGIYSRASAFLLNVTLAYNTTNDPTSGSNLYNDTSQISLRNTILASASPNDNCANNGGFINSLGHNLESTNTCGLSATGDLVNTAPLLLPLQDHGGPTPTHALLTGSPALDAGDAANCPATDQRGFPRPTDDNGDGVAVCDIGAFEGALAASSQSFSSIGIQDGWVLETAENSNIGGMFNATAATFALGDDQKDRQFRAILAFNTAALPDNAVILSATVKIKRHSVVGTNPFLTHGNILIDIRKNFFGSQAALQSVDFQARAHRNRVGRITSATTAGNWYSASLGTAALPFINKAGLTQLRLRFAIDDNGDASADFIRFFSGNAVNASYRPILLVEYYIP